MDEIPIYWRSLGMIYQSFTYSCGQRVCNPGGKAFGATVNDEACAPRLPLDTLPHPEQSDFTVWHVPRSIIRLEAPWEE